MEKSLLDEALINKLKAFKGYVHNRLDKMGVPVDPEPEKNASTGCRIEGRLNYLEKMITPPVQVDYLRMVALFHLLFQHPVLDSPQIPDQKRVGLRIALINEEAKEFEEAAKAGDIVGVADALCDLQYVLAGAVLEFGLKDKFPAMFNEVQRSNMSKACETEREAQETILAYLHEGHQDEMHYEERDGKFLVYRTKDRKTLKARFYSPADLKQFL